MRKTLCAERIASSWTAGGNHEPWYTRGRCKCRPVNQLKRPKPQTTKGSKQCQHGDAPRRPNRKTQVKHNENITDGHALCNVRGDDDSLENGSGSSLNFVFFWASCSRQLRKNHIICSLKEDMCATNSWTAHNHVSGHTATNDKDVYATNRSTDNSDAKFMQSVWASISSHCDVRRWCHCLRNAAETTSKPNSKSQNGTHRGLALTTMRHTLCHPTYRETNDVSRNRHIAPRCRACCDLQRNSIVVLRNSSQLRHTEKHDGKPHRGTKTMSAQYGETCSHASTMKRLSKSPTATQRKTKHASQQPHSQRSCLRSCTTATHITKEHVSTRSQL